MARAATMTALREREDRQEAAARFADQVRKRRRYSGEFVGSRRAARRRWKTLRAIGRTGV
jgi:hypothetical protein